MKNLQSLKYYALIGFTTLLMGVSFPVGKMGLAYAPPLLLMGIRFVLAGGLMALLAAGRPRPRGTRMWLQAAVIGLFQSAGVMGCAYTSMRWITSGESAIITCANPLLVIVLGTLLNGAVYSVRQWAGVAIGFAGVFVAFGLHVGLNPGTWIGLAGAFCFAVSTLLVKRWGAAFDMNALAAYQMLAGGLVLLAAGALTEPVRLIATPASLSILLWLAVMGSIVQFSLWYHLLRSGDPARASSFLFLVPLFGVLSGALLLGEPVSWLAGAGGALIGIGIVLVNREGPKRLGRPAAVSPGHAPEQVRSR